MNSSVKILVTGDFCPQNTLVEKPISIDDCKKVYGEMFEYISKADIAITNLESPLTNASTPINKIGPALKRSSKMASFLAMSGFDLVTLANNHIYDFGQKGLEDTINALQKSEIQYTGAGLTLAEATKTSFQTVKGKIVAIVNFAENEFNHATTEHGGSNPMDIINCSRQIQAARKQADFVLVIIHGGHEHYHYPSPETIKRYRFFSEQGATAIVAHHTHFIGPYEIYNGVPIFYSLGNFLFDYGKNQPLAWYEGYAVSLTLSDNGIDFELHTYDQCLDGQLAIHLHEEDSLLNKKLSLLCKELKDEKLIQVKWDQFVNNMQCIGVTAKLSRIGRWPRAILRRLGILEMFNSKQHLYVIKQALTCEAHREKTIAVLEKIKK